MASNQSNTQKDGNRQADLPEERVEISPKAAERAESAILREVKNERESENSDPKLGGELQDLAAALANAAHLENYEVEVVRDE